MKYYKIQVELGHLGCGKSLPSWVYIKAKTILKAIEVAQKFPAVKHSKLPLKAIEITEEEYLVGIESKNYYEKMESIFGVEIV